MLQHPSAAAIYVDIGAVEFLNQLRPNIEPVLHKTVDAILRNIFHLPAMEPLRHQQECVYQPHNSSGLALLLNLFSYVLHKFDF